MGITILYSLIPGQIPVNDVGERTKTCIARQTLVPDDNLKIAPHNGHCDQADSLELEICGKVY